MSDKETTLMIRVLTSVVWSTNILGFGISNTFLGYIFPKYK